MNNIEFDPNGVKPDNGNYFGLPIDPERAALVLISAPWDTTVSVRAGSSYAPDAIIDASRSIELYEPSAPNSWRKGIATAPIDYSIQDLSHRLRSDAERIVKFNEEFGPITAAIENIMHERRLRRVNEGSASINEKIYNQAKYWLDKGKLVGLITYRDITKLKDNPNACKDSKGRLRVAAGIGITPDAMDRVSALVAEEVDAVVLDSAHGHTKGVVDLLRKIKETFPHRGEGMSPPPQD